MRFTLNIERECVNSMVCIINNDKRPFLEVIALHLCYAQQSRRINLATHTAHEKLYVLIITQIQAVGFGGISLALGWRKLNAAWFKMRMIIISIRRFKSQSIYQSINHLRFIESISLAQEQQLYFSMFKGLCLFIYLSCAAGKGSFLEENPYYAKTLNSQSFNKELAKDGDLLVMFYAPWCEHCKELSPAFEEAAKMLSQKESHLKVTLAKVDGSENEELAKKYGIQGYPTLRYFKEREVQVMDATNSGRSADEIFSFVKKIASAPDRITHIGDDAGMKKFFELGGVFAVGFFESAEHAEFFVGVAEKCVWVPAPVLCS